MISSINIVSRVDGMYKQLRVGRPPPIRGEEQENWIIGMALATTSLAWLSGCSAPNQIGSPKYSEYENDHSMAWNLAEGQ
ncbi:hypothetical protein [Marinobacter zhanjiangensis]|uniref:hypothetical protein n=1 Tax=Marinobacter zhanjiangensis TaxID=578215 RepID=UPI0016722BA6|nr:hypothetical protein [Marinobacter zhanjiangensis]